MKTYRLNHKNGQGFILVVTLVFLLMLTILGIAQISINATQTQVATNVNDIETSFEKTEGAVNEAVNKVLNNSINPINFLTNANGFYLFQATQTPIWQTVNWGSNATTSSFSGLNGSQAHYVVEQLPSVIKPGQNMRSLTRIYRITGRSVGQTGNASVFIQNTMQVQQ